MFTMHPWLWLLVILVIAWRANLSSGETRVVCYYTNWSVYRPGTAKFNPQNINPYLCTHLIYAFGGFTKENNFKPFDKYQDIEKGGYAKFTGLKTYNKNLKTMLAVGGWNEGSSRFSPMVANADRRKEFVKNSIKFLRQNHFDGLDLDWEYPAFRDGGKSRDRDNYATLVQELREEYDRESAKTGRPRLLLTMAVPAGIEYINKGYDVPRLMKYLDWMNILSYDYHSAFEPAVNHHSPLYSLEEESEYNYDSELNINHTIYHYLEAGAEPSKLVLGIPTYGRSYTLFNPEANAMGDPADGPGEMGDATRENGYLAYYEICEKIKSEDWIVEQPNPNAMGPYAYKDNQWVGYDDEDIVRKKSQFVVENKLGGIMFWSIDNDDFRGNCDGKPYPLIEAAKEALLTAAGSTHDNVIPPGKAKLRRVRPNSKKAKDEDAKPTQNSGGRQSVDSPTLRKRTRPKAQNKEQEGSQTNTKRRIRVHKNEHADEEVDQSKKRRVRVEQKTHSKRGSSSTTASSLVVSTPRYTTPEPPTTPDAGSDFKCEDEGFFPHPRDCRKYFWCLSSGPSDLGIVAHQFTCPSGLYFNKAADSCDYTQNVLCSKKKAKGTTTTTTTTTTAEPTTSTRRVPPKITAATFRNSFTTTTPTTTSAFEDEYEYVYVDEEEDEAKLDSEEDPRVIKELIDLIRKAGGIEELEKQLKLSEDGSVSVSSPGSTTPPTFSKSLYERVLSRAAARNTEKPQQKTKNSRGPQFEEKEDTVTKRNRPQYTVITRQRSSTEKVESEEENDTTENEATAKRNAHPEYKTITRNRVSTTESDLETVITKKELEENEETTRPSPEYITIRRPRPTQEPTPKYVEIRSRSTSPANDEETTPQPENAIASENAIEQKNATEPPRASVTEEALTTAPPNLSQTVSFTESEKRYRSTTVPSTAVPSSTVPATTSSTKVSDPISRSVRPRPLQTADSEKPPARRAGSRFTPDPRYKTPPRRVTAQRPDPQEGRASLDDDFEDDEENTSNETGSARFAPRPTGSSEPQEKPRRRGTAKFETPRFQSGQPEDQYYYDLESKAYERKYRPDIAQEIADLSSLTSADFADRQRLNGTRRRVVSRQRAPAVQEEIKGEKPQEARNATDEARPKFGRKPIGFGSSNRRVSGEESSTQNPIQKKNNVNPLFSRPPLRRFTQESAKTSTEPEVHSSTTESPFKRNRKVIRRFRPTSSTTTTTTEATTEQAKTTTSVKPTEEGENAINATETDAVHQTTLPSLFNIKVEENAIASNATDIDSESDDDIISDEEEENIKLSETNIRENSKIRINSLNGDGGKDEKKIHEGKGSNKFTFDLEDETTRKPPVTQPAPILRTRKIIRKLTPTTEAITSTTESYKGRTRKVIRRLRPTTTTTAPNRLEDHDKVYEPKRFRPPTHIREESEKEPSFKSRQRFNATESHEIRPIVRKVNFRRRQNATERPVEINRQRVNLFQRSTTEKHEEASVTHGSEENAEATTTEAAAQEQITTIDDDLTVNITAITENSTTQGHASELPDLYSGLSNATEHYPENQNQTRTNVITSTEQVTENEEQETTTVVENETTTADEQLLLTTISEDLTTPDPQNATNITVETEKTTIRTTTPFYYRQKLSRPPFLHHIRHTTESAEKSSSTTEHVQNGFGRYNRRRNRYKSRTTETSASSVAQEAVSSTSEQYKNVDGNQANENTSEDSTIAVATNETVVEDNSRRRNRYKSRTTETSASSVAQETVSSSSEQYKNVDGNQTNENTSEDSTVAVATNETVVEDNSRRRNRYKPRFDKSTTETSASSVAQETVSSSSEQYKNVESNHMNENTTTEDSTIAVAINETAVEHNSTVKEEEDDLTTTELIREREEETTTLPYTTNEAVDETFATTQRSSNEETTLRLESEPVEATTVELLDNKTTSEVPTPLPTVTAEEQQNLTETSHNATSVRRGYVPLRRITPKPDVEVTSEKAEEPSSRAPFKPASPRLKFRPRQQPTERTLLHKSTTKKVLITSSERAIPRRFYLRPSSTKKPQPVEEEEGDEDVRDEDLENEEEGVDEDTPGDDEEVPAKEEPTEDEDEQVSNPFYSETKKQLTPNRGYKRPISSRFANVNNNPQQAINQPQPNVELRNKLFNKPRKVNTPYAGIAASSSTTPSPVPPILTTVATPTTTHILTTTPERDLETTEGTTEVSSQAFTLQHIFAQVDNASQSTTEAVSAAANRSEKKIERLIEVNRIVEVSLKEGKVKHNTMVENQFTLVPTVDRIGAINRVTIIKVVDPVNGTSEKIVHQDDPHKTNVTASTIDTTPSTTSLSDQKTTPLVQEASPAIVSRYGNQLTGYGQNLEVIVPSHTKEEEEYAKAHIHIYGKSVVNTFTPKPSAFSGESSTIALEGLFQARSNEEGPHEEILQTQHANYVNIKILDQDNEARNLRYNKEQPLIPIKLLQQDDYTTSKAQVVEITPDMRPGTIKIAPIAISLGNMEPVSKYKSDSGQQAAVVLSAQPESAT